MSRNARPAIAAVIFDMDGLMLDTERLARRAWQAAMAAHGFTLPDEIYLQFVGRTREDTEQILRRTYGPDFPYAEVYRERQANVAAAIARDGLPLKPGLLELLDWLEEAGLPRAVASSSSRAAVLDRLGRVGLLDRFAAHVGGDEVRRGKPEPDIFLAAAARLGLPAEGCLVLEDSELGVQAAHAAGMRALMIPDLKPPSPGTAALAEAVLLSLHEARRFIQKLLLTQNSL